MMSVTAYAETETEVTGSTTYSDAPSISIGKEYVTLVAERAQDQWYKFTTPATKGYCYLQSKNISVPAHTTTSYANLYVYVCNAYGEAYITDRLTRADYGGSDWHYAVGSLEPSTTYYVRINAGEYGTYPGYMKFKLSYKKDKYANELSGATAVALNKVNTSTLDAYEDEDWFKFTTGDSTKYELYGKNVDITTH